MTLTCATMKRSDVAPGARRPSIEGEFVFVDHDAEPRAVGDDEIEVAILRAVRGDIVLEQQRPKQLATQYF